MDRREALEAAIERALERDDAEAPEWVWGKRDCLLWAAGVVLDGIGIDPAEPWRGRYDTEQGASHVIGPKGLLFVSRKRAREIGAVRVKIADAQIGDWGVVKSREGACSVLKYRGPWWVGAANRGFTLIREERIAAAWSFC